MRWFKLSVIIGIGALGLGGCVVASNRVVFGDGTQCNAWQQGESIGLVCNWPDGVVLNCEREGALNDTN